MSYDAIKSTVTNAASSAVSAEPAAVVIRHNEPELLDDIVAGWFGGALGILASNPLEVLKVRMQTAIPAATAADTPSTPRAGAGSRPPASTREGLLLLWRAEGARFLVAGAAAPILGLAFIDAAFFGIYGRSMSMFNQDRQNPSEISRVFASGAIAGGLCALLQTPIEVIKCRAQVENQASSRKLGSYGITKLIANQEGFKGFYHGGLTTAFRDTVSSGIFFSSYIVFRRLLRFENPLASEHSSSPSSVFSWSTNQALSLQQVSRNEEVTPVPEILPDIGPSRTVTVLQTLLAGGLAGCLSAMVPYPLDIIKTRLQTFHSQPAPTITSVSRQIYSDGMKHYVYMYPTTTTHALLARLSRFKRSWHPGERSAWLELWSTRLLGLRAYFVGYRPTIASSFIGSAATITCVEAVLLAFANYRKG